MDSELQRRYFQLRTQLSGLNYSCNFGLDALDVVQELFTDLVSTTESYSVLQDKETKLSHDLSIAQTHLLPLRKEIGRLTKENHHFHLDNIRIKEESVEELGKLMTESQKAQLEVTELKHVVYLKDIELQKAESERGRLRQAYEELAAASLTGAATKVKRAIKSTGGLASVESSGPNSSSIVDNQSQNTTSAVTDRALMEKMRSQIDSLTDALSKAEDRSRTLETAVRRRELELGKELQRITSRSIEGTVDGEGRMEMLVMADSANARIIDQLNGQVDFLNDQLATREAQLADLGEKLVGAKELRIECENRGKLLDASREENAMLVAELRELEERIEEFNHYTDPEGGLSIHSLSQGSSVGAASENADRNRGVSPMSTPSPSAKLKARDTGRAVEKLRDEKEGLVGDVSDLNQRMSEMASEENMLRTRLFRAEERIDELKTTLQQHVIEMERMSSQLSVRTSEGTDLRLQLGDAKSALNLAQESLREKSEKLNGFETQNNKAHLVSRLEKEKKYLEETLTSLNNELSSARKDKFQISLQYDELLNNEVRTLRADCDSLSSTVESLTDELTEMRGRSLMLEAECSQIQDELTSERARANSLQRQCEDATSRYSQTSADLTKAMSTVVQLQSVVRHLQSDEEITSTTYTSQSYLHSGASPGSPGAQSDASVAALISPNGRGKTAEINYLKKQLADERGLSEKLTNELRSLQAESIALRQQQQVATSRLHTLESEHRSQSKLLEEKNVELSRCSSEMAMLRVEEMRLREEIKNSKAVCDALSISDENHLSKIESLTMQLDRLSSENRLLARRAEETSLTLSEHQQKSSDAGSVAHSAISRVAAAKRVAESVQTTLREKQRELSAMQGRIFDLEQRLQSEGSVLEKARRERDAAAQERDVQQAKVAELKSVINSLDSTSRDGALRATKLAGQAEQVRQALGRCEEENALLRGHIRDRDEKIASLTEALTRLDEQRDSLQYQLDAVAEEATASDDVRDKAQRDIGALSARLQECESRLLSTTEEVAVSRRHCAVAEGRIASLKSELEEAQRRFNMSHAEVAGAAEDLQLMTRENQAITSELAEVSFERDRLMERVSELSVAASNLEQARRGVEIERGDLLMAYRTALQQKRRMETDLATMATMKQRLSVSLQQMHSDAAELRAQLSDKASHLDREAYDRASLISQIEALNSQLVSASQSVEGVEADNRRLIQENYTLTQANQMLHERITMLLKRATSASDSNKVLATRLAGVERERDAMRAVAGIEKQRASDLGAVVELSRAQAATATAQVDRYRLALVSTSNSRGEVHESDIGSAVIEHVAGRKLVTTTSTTVTSSRHSNVNIQHQSSASGSVRRVAESEDISRSKEALLDSVLGHANESGDDSNAGSESDTQ